MRGGKFPVVKDIVLLGGGHAHVSVLRNFGMFPINGARITLISPEVDTPYSGMLPGLIAGHYTFDEAHIDLAPLSRFADARYFQTAVDGIDPERREVHCSDGRPPVRYDVLSINTGSTPVFAAGLTLERDVIPVKPVSKFLDCWEKLKERVRAESSRRIGVVGAGAGGIELLLSMQHSLAEPGGAAAGRFHIFTRDDVVLKTHGAAVRDAMTEALDARDVTVHRGFDVSGVTADGVTDGDRVVPVDEVIWVTGAQPPEWFATSGLDLDARGFIAINRQLRSTSHQGIFGAGDAVTMVDNPRPKSGVFAVRQGPVLAQNLRANVLGRALKTYRPQSAFLSLISTGDKFAIASYAGWSVKGAWVWRWKDRIDRRFMETFSTLPEMGERPITVPTVADVPDDVRENRLPGAMRCAGCGAKVGGATLQRALAQVPGIAGDGAADASAGILLGVGDDAAAIDVPEGKVLVQTVDQFPAMIEDPFVFGQIAANHGLGDIYAMGAEPHSALLSIALPFAPNEKREADLIHLLAGVKSVLDTAGCRIVGGHTGEGAELTLGLSINGFVSRENLLRKGGLTPGLALILTKPLGSGALFAAHGRRQAKGCWVEAVIANALVSNARAGNILRDAGAVAMTDVTGFGLVGHLGEMLDASGCGALLRLADVPLLDGAVDVVEKGVVSTLQRDNEAQRGDIDVAPSLMQAAAYKLLFDPQTGGGLLAGLPHGQAGAAVDRLREAGYGQAAVIGETVAKDAGHGVGMKVV